LASTHDERSGQSREPVGSDPLPGSGLLLSRAASPSCWAAQAGIGVEEVLRVQMQHAQAWGDASLKTLEHSIGLGWAEGADSQ